MRISDWSSDVCSSDLRRTLNYGLVIGLLSGLGAALADALFAAAAAGGLASLMDFLLGIERQLRVAGGVFLVALGIWTFFKHPVEEGANPSGHHGAIATTFLLTLTTPMTLLAFVGFFVARSEEHTSELQSLMR